MPDWGGLVKKVKSSFSTVTAKTEKPRKAVQAGMALGSAVMSSSPGHIVEQMDARPTRPPATHTAPAPESVVRQANRPLGTSRAAAPPDSTHHTKHDIDALKNIHDARKVDQNLRRSGGDRRSGEDRRQGPSNPNIGRRSADGTYGPHVDRGGQRRGIELRGTTIHDGSAPRPGTPRQNDSKLQQPSGAERVSNPSTAVTAANDGAGPSTRRNFDTSTTRRTAERAPSIAEPTKRDFTPKASDPSKGPSK